MKFGVSLRHDDALAEARSANRRPALDDGGVGVRRRDQLEQLQVARRVEEVRAEEVPAEASVRPSASAAIGMPEVFEETIVSGAPGGVDAREQRLLDVEALDDGLDDPVGAEARRGPRRSRRSGSAWAWRVKNGSGLQRAARFMPVAGGVG